MGNLTPRKITRNYMSLAGVDFSNDASKVLLNRSPDAVNMYRDYRSTHGYCVETRPGYKKIGQIGTKVNGLYFFETNNTFEVIVHSGTKLLRWDNFPSTPEVTTELHSSMNDAKSSAFVFGDKFYINDGLNYIVYNGTSVTNVSVDATVPTTTIARSPSGGGEVYQPVNLLQSSRYNTFIGDGTSVDYYLDATEIDTVEEVTVNGVVTTAYTVNNILGKITFTTAPEAPGTPGQANVVVKFSKFIPDYINRISKCTIAKLFDRRVFFSGNPDFPNAIFHCELENPAYVSDLAYYQDGEDNTAVVDMVVGNNVLVVLKESSTQDATIFYHTPTIDYQYGKIYPMKQSSISTGCYSRGINFNDDIVFMSKNGLEGIDGNIAEKQLLSHRSSLVDSKMVNENNFNHCEMQEWNGYLMCLINGKIYLADSRQKFAGLTGFEYEWYYWDNIQCGTSLARILKEYKGNLYFGCEDGSICHFEGTNDNGLPTYSCWTTPRDNFGSENLFKTTNKRGGVVKIKTIPNGQIKLGIETNKSNYKDIGKWSSTGFDFANIDFNNFSFATTQNSRIVFKLKEKKIIDISLKFYSDEMDKPFGLYNAVLEVFTGGYVK